MSFGLALATFAIIIPAELPDKTFIAGIVLSARHRALPVWAGAASGLVVQALVGVVAGRLLALAPHRVVEIVVAAAFFGGAAYLFSSSESSAEQRGTELAEREEMAENSAGSPSAVRIAATTFAIVTLAEFGDLTQVVIANLSARYEDPLSVFVGASAGFVLISGIGVAAGRTVTRLVPLRTVRKVSALVLCGLGVWSALGAAGVTS